MVLTPSKCWVFHAFFLANVVNDPVIDKYVSNGFYDPSCLTRSVSSNIIIDSNVVVSEDLQKSGPYGCFQK